MGKKSNKSLRESTGKKFYTDSDEIVRLRKVLIDTEKDDHYNSREQNNRAKNKRTANFKSLNEIRKSNY